MSVMKTKKKGDISETFADGYNKQRMAQVKMLHRMILKARNKRTIVVSTDWDQLIFLIILASFYYLQSF